MRNLKKHAMVRAGQLSSKPIVSLGFVKLLQRDVKSLVGQVLCTLVTDFICHYSMRTTKIAIIYPSRGEVRPAGYASQNRGLTETLKEQNLGHLQLGGRRIPLKWCISMWGNAPTRTWSEPLEKKELVNFEPRGCVNRQMVQ